MGISLRHSGHFFAVGSGGVCPRRLRSLYAFSGATTAKYIAAATSRNEISALRKRPYLITLPFNVKLKAEKSGLPAMAAISGVRMSPTNDVITAPNAAAIRTATARSITLPRITNCLNPLNMRISFFGRHADIVANPDHL